MYQGDTRNDYKGRRLKTLNIMLLTIYGFHPLQLN